MRLGFYLIFSLIQVTTCVPQFSYEDEYYESPEARFIDNYPAPYEHSLAPCNENERIYADNNQCYMLNTQGPCKENMKFYPTGGSSYGVCDCNNEDIRACDSPLIYFALTDSCYHIYTQGPCRPNEWIVWNQHREPTCQPNVCLSNLENVEAYPIPPSPSLLPPSSPEERPQNESPGPPQKESTEPLEDEESTSSTTELPQEQSSQQPEEESTEDTTDVDDLLAVEKNKLAESPLGLANFDYISLPLAESRVECGTWIRVHGNCYKTNSKAFCSRNEILKWVWSAYDVNLRHVFEPACVTETTFYENNLSKVSDFVNPPIIPTAEENFS